ncbi:YbbR-like domain-containing protein [uncultured Megasphaera sp.]|uniref:CdaR family protein n=1 Tax=uncultured Megasphaera sp. TaxID=165188 RepID=UPI002657BA39|nr:CdaR family protein [uncultured Megasphaera sp.]
MNKLDKKWQLKLICLILAIVLWFFIINEQNPQSEGSYTVPVVVENLDSQFITSNVPKTVYVRLSGPRNTIINVDPSTIKAYIDLSDAQEGEMDVPVHVEIPTGTELKKQSIATAKIMVDVYTVQEFVLTPNLTGRMEDDTFVSSLKMVPEKVVVSGARRLIQQVEQAVVEIPVGDKTEDFSLMTPIRLLAADGSRVEGLEMTPWQSNVRVAIGRNGAVKEVPVHAQTNGDPAVSVSAVTVSPATVTAKGDANILKNLSRIDLPALDVTGLDQDKDWKMIIPPVNGIVFEPNAVDVTVHVDRP